MRCHPAAYQAVKQHRADAADIEVILVDGGVVAPEHRMPHTKGNVATTFDSLNA